MPANFPRHISAGTLTALSSGTMSQDVFSSLMNHYGNKAAEQTARELRERQRQLLWQKVRRKGILVGLLVTAVCAFVFREDIGDLVPHHRSVKRSTHEDRTKENIKAIKAESKERQDALENIFK